MRNDTEHEAYAHYEVRNHRYKLIYWYNDDLLVGGALPGGEDCRSGSCLTVRRTARVVQLLCRFEVWEVVIEMTRLLERKMMEIGDEPAHERFAGQ